MSEENVEIVRTATEAFNRRDGEALVGFYAPDAEYRVAREHPEARTCHGTEEIRAYAESWWGQLDQMHLEIEDLRDLGDRVVVLGRIQGTGAGSGVELDIPLASISTVRDGKITRSEEFLDPREALEAAGLSE